jgi:UDP-2-acetamido-3-amino-2,3-dideoxy-glucuronate N-acetyltransferase
MTVVPTERGPTGRAPAETTINDTADVAATAEIGAGSQIWHLAQVREGARLGLSCVVGRGAYIGPGVRIGDHVKIQNYALVYDPAEIGAGVFIGPAAVLTNDQHPRSVDPHGVPRRPDDWTPVGVTVREGASIGARAVCVAPVTIGRWAMVGAGAVVTADVPDFALVVGVPARHVGWVGRAGVPLRPDGNGRWRCERTAELFREVEGGLYELSS